MSGSLILTEEWGTNLVVYLYDNNGAPIGMRYRTSSMAEGVFYTFWFERNLQGDVVAVYNETGTKVRSYTYDAWGNKTTTIHNSSGTNSYAQYNAITYRGYYFDSETNLYYVSSRYYDAKIGRFVNADAIGLLGANEDFASLNLFAYCGNNPVSREDDGGEFWNVIIGATVGAVVNAVTTAVDTYKSTGSINWGKVGISAAVGAVSGGVAATGLGVIAQAGITAGVAFAGDVATQVVCEKKTLKKTNYKKAAYNGVLSGVTSVIGSAYGSITSYSYASTGNNLLSKGQDKLLTGYVRKAVGQSHSTLIKQGNKLVSTGMKYINTGRGISSVTGTILTWGVSQKYSWG